MATNIEQARFNMIEQQVRTWDVLDERALDALKAVPREDFVPSRYRKLAFMDVRIPLGYEQVMMKPVEEGRVLQALNLQPGQSVLEIGTGSGFLAACMAYLGARVTTLEIIPDIAESATRRLERSETNNVTVLKADGLSPDDLPQGAFDCVVITGSSADVPELLKAKVSIGGCLFAIRGDSPAMEAICMKQTAAGDWSVDSLFETDIPRLVGAEDAPTFEF